MTGTATPRKIAVSPAIPAPDVTSPASAPLTSAVPASVTAGAAGSSLFARRTPSASAICTQVAPVRCTASCAWSSRSGGRRASTSDRNDGVWANTSAPLVRARSRPSRSAATCWRDAARPRASPASAARSADTESTPRTIARTTTTTAAVARKRRQKSGTPPRPLVPVTRFRWVLLAELVLVRARAPPARVERHVYDCRPAVPDGHLLRVLAGAVVPGPQPVAAGGHAGDLEAPVGAGLRVPRRGYGDDVGDHARMNVTEDRVDSRAADACAAHLAAPVEPEVEGPGAGVREDVVAEWVVVGEGHRAAGRDDAHRRPERAR